MAVRQALARALAGWPGRLLRVALAVLPLVWLARRVDLADAVHHAGTIGLGPILGSFALWTLAVVVGAVRWGVLMRAYGADELPPLSRMIKDVYVASYFNLLPSGLAGDVVRALRVKRYAPDVGASLMVIAMERVVGLAGLLGIVGLTAMAGAGLATGAAGVAFRVACVGGAAVSLGLLGVPWLVHRSARSRAFVGRIPVAGALLLRLAPARRPAYLAAAVALSFGTQGLALLIAELLLFRLADTAQLVVAAGTIPFAILVTYVPLTPGAVVQREAAYVLFLGLAGVSADRAVAVSVLSFSVALATAAIGGLLYTAERAGWIAIE